MTVGAVRAAEMGSDRETGRARPGWVFDRPEVVAVLDQATRQAAITVLVAAAGSGKSTLLAQWAATRAGPVRWARFRPTDGGPLACGRRLVAALALDPDVVAGLGPPDLADARFRRRLAEAVVVEARATSGACLVVEDLHRADPATARSLAEIVDVVSHDLPVVVASRVDPHWPLSEWRLAGRLRELRQHDLDLDDAHAAELVRSIAPGRLTPGEVELLVDRCQGWAAGLVLSGLSARDHPDPTGFATAFSGADRTVADYLFDEVYSTLDERERRFLLATSVCPRFDAELAAALTGDEHAAALLRRLSDRLMLIRPVGDRPGWYRYHDLFRDMLRQQLDLERPGHARVLARVAASWSDRRGDIVARCAYLAQVGDWDEIGAAVTTRMRDALAGGSHRQLVACLELIPVEHRDLPVVLALATACATSGLAARARALCEVVVADPRCTPDHRATVDRLRCGLVEWGEAPDAVIAAADRHLAAADRPDGPRPLWITTSSGPATMRTGALAARGRARDLLGDAEGARADLRAAASVADADGISSVDAQARLALVVARAGGLDEAADRARRALLAATDLGLADHPLVAPAHLALAVVALARGRLDDAERELDLCRAGSLADARWLTLVEERTWRAEAHRLRGDELGVKRCVEDVGQHPTPPPALRSDLLALQARILVDQGRMGDAAHVLDSAPATTPAVRAARALTAVGLPGGVTLTEREQQVLERLVSRQTSAEIGTELHLSVHTVKTHQRHIYQKLGVSSRRDAIGAAELRGLI